MTRAIVKDHTEMISEINGFSIFTILSMAISTCNQQYMTSQNNQ